MPQILRHDGVPFVVYTYRELVTAKKYNLLKRELEMLAREHGANARFYIYPDGDLEAIFSQEEGYLLGENIWQHFGNPLRRHWQRSGSAAGDGVYLSRASDFSRQSGKRSVRFHF